jgi:hypothetical protein
MSLVVLKWAPMKIRGTCAMRRSARWSWVVIGRSVTLEIHFGICWKSESLSTSRASSKFYVQHSTLLVRSSSNPPSLILYMESKLGCDILTIHNLTLADYLCLLLFYLSFPWGVKAAQTCRSRGGEIQF